MRFFAYQFNGSSESPGGFGTSKSSLVVSCRRQTVPRVAPWGMSPSSPLAPMDSSYLLAILVVRCVPAVAQDVWKAEAKEASGVTSPSFKTYICGILTCRSSIRGWRAPERRIDVRTMQLYVIPAFHILGVSRPRIHETRGKSSPEAVVLILLDAYAARLSHKRKQRISHEKTKVWCPQATLAFGKLKFVFYSNARLPVMHRYLRPRSP